MLRFLLILLGFIFLIFVQDKDTELVLDESIETILTLGLPATFPIYLMVLMFDIVMVIVKFSSSESDFESAFFKKVMIFEIGFIAILIYAWSPYFVSVFV